VLFVLDDFHWGDLPSVKFLDSALRNLGELPLMVVALGQPELHEMFPTLWARRGLFELRITGLSRRSSESLVRDVLGGDVSGDVLGRIVEKAQGNPFWLEELVRAEAESEEAPEAIVLLAQARLERLESNARLVLRAASVLGRRFWDAGVAALLGSKLSGVQLARLLASLEESEVVTGRAPNQPSGQREYEFCSTLLRDAAYGTLTEADRQRAHYAAAVWIEQQGYTDAVALAEHFEKGCSTARALAWYQKAAQQALSGNDWHAARERAGRARAAGAQGEQLMSLSFVEAEASKWLGDNEGALGRSLEVLDLSEPGWPQWCRACGEAIATAGKLGRDSVYRTLAAGLLSAAPEPDNLASLMTALSRGATQLVLCGEQTLAAQLLERVEKLCELGEPPAAAMGWILEARAVHAGAMDRASERVALAEAAADQFELTGDMRNACLQRISVGFACVEVGAYARARGALSEGLEVAKRMALSNSIPIARAQLGRALLHLGKLEPARALLHEASTELDRHGNNRLAGAVRCYLAALLLKQGNLREAERVAGEAVAILKSVPSLRPSALATLVMVLLEKGQAGRVLAIAREANAGVGAETRLNFGEALVRLSLVLALQATGHDEEAESCLRSAQSRLLQRAALISDPALKDGFLTAVPENARTIQLAESLQL
jgi:tetratricopeptide (TPR) repeat protein